MNILSLAKNYDKISKVLEWFENKNDDKCMTDDTCVTNVIEVIDDKIKINLPDSEEKRTTIRVNAKVWDDFNEFCSSENNKHLKKRDILSMALLEFIDRYKR
ncbi:hypothetical protein ACFIJ5_18835 (plasmid) [Haloimpatiens sp. FM7330]